MIDSAACVSNVRSPADHAEALLRLWQRMNDSPNDDWPGVGAVSSLLCALRLYCEFNNLDFPVEGRVGGKGSPCCGRTAYLSAGVMLLLPIWTRIYWHAGDNEVADDALVSSLLEALAAYCRDRRIDWELALIAAAQWRDRHDLAECYPRCLSRSTPGEAIPL